MSEDVKIIYDQYDEDEVMSVYKYLMGDVILDFANETQATPRIVRVLVDVQDHPIVLISDTNTIYNWAHIIRVRKSQV